MKKNIDFGPVADLYDVYVQWDLDVPFFTEICAAAAGDVLELMCGTGRLSIPLLQSGVRLWCVDYSAEMLEVLDRRLHENHLSAVLHEQDVRALDLGRVFDLIILPFHALSEIVDAGDRALALAAIRRHLAPGGRFVVTLHNPVVQAATLDGTRRLLCDRAIPGRDAILKVWFSGLRPDAGGIVDARQEYEIRATDERLLERRELPLRYALISAGRVRAPGGGRGISHPALLG